MLAFLRILGERAVIEVIFTEQHADDPDGCIDQHPAGNTGAQDPVRQNPLRGLNAENHRVENEPGGENDARLKTPARPEIAVELNIQGKQQDKRQQQFRYNSKDQVFLHASSSPSRGSLCGGGGVRPRRQLPRSRITPIPAVKITVTSPSVS